MAWVKGLAALQLVVLMMGALSSCSKAFAEEEAFAEDVQSRPPPPPPLLHSYRAPKPHPLPSVLGYHVAVEGVIYCKSCKLPGYNKFVDASPLPGAVAKLQCNIGEHTVTLEATTDKNGYFFILAHEVTSYNVPKCRVFLVSSPLAYCKKPSKFNGGVKGSRLKYERILSVGTDGYRLYTTGFLQFVPTKSTPCPK